jgi:uncharacterized protein
MLAREGDLIRTSDNVIFDVKGLIHPPNKVIAFPRYIPSSEGTRGKPGEMYSKIYNLSERFLYLQKKTPWLLFGDPVFGEKLCEVPFDTINKHYDPVKKLQALRSSKKLQPLERKALTLAQELKEAANIPWSSIGISGSIMAGLFTLQSDIDPLIYGVESSRKAYAALQKLQKTQLSKFKPYNRDELGTLYEFRSKDTKMSFEDFERVESRKAFQGKYDGIDYFVRFVKSWKDIDEKYGDFIYENAGYARIKAAVSDDSEALFTPCTYKLEKTKVIEGPKLEPITEIASFRGRFCEQAKPGEVVIAQGKVECVNDKKLNRTHYRIIIGNKPADFMSLSQF